MQLEYEIKFMDFLKFQLVHQFFSIPIQIFAILFAGIVPLIQQLNNQCPLIVSVLLFLFVYFSMWIFQLIFLIYYLWLKADHILLTKQFLEVSSDGIFSKNKYLKGTYFWNNKMKVVERTGNVLIYVSANIAVLIPKRAFKSREECKELMDFVKKEISESN